ncbi:unnamed protein product [Owenia fusiformis]|uniref:Uncharacterized protein n=1 Tax=Owenia fusiformis TaxID=6347 RepID=A0A8J1UDS2_OWEFU|nr:unnamed protein product [Owenia fusiformis]
MTDAKVTLGLMFVMILSKSTRGNEVRESVTPMVTYEDPVGITLWQAKVIMILPETISNWKMVIYMTERIRDIRIVNYAGKAGEVCNSTVNGTADHFVLEPYNIHVAALNTGSTLQLDFTVALVGTLTPSAEAVLVPNPMSASLCNNVSLTESTVSVMSTNSVIMSTASAASSAITLSNTITSELSTVILSTSTLSIPITSQPSTDSVVITSTIVPMGTLSSTLATQTPETVQTTSTIESTNTLSTTAQTSTTVLTGSTIEPTSTVSSNTNASATVPTAILPTSTLSGTIIVQTSTIVPTVSAIVQTSTLSGTISVQTSTTVPTASAIVPTSTLSGTTIAQTSTTVPTASTIVPTSTLSRTTTAQSLETVPTASRTVPMSSLITTNPSTIATVQRSTTLSRTSIHYFSSTTISYKYKRPKPRHFAPSEAKLAYLLGSMATLLMVAALVFIVVLDSRRLFRNTRWGCYNLRYGIRRLLKYELDDIDIKWYKKLSTRRIKKELH